jgi:predicted naringenin-chalcone synthase
MSAPVDHNGRLLTMNEKTAALAAERNSLAPLDECGLARVLGWGTALPPYRYPQEEIADWLASSLDARSARRLRAAFRGSGIEFRSGCLPDFSSRCAEPLLFHGAPPTTGERMAAYRDLAPALACAAARRALEVACVLPERVTHLFTSTCTGFAAPGPDQDVIERLGLLSSVRRVLFGFQGCSAGIAALRTAAEIARGDPDAVILVVAVELSSLHFQPSLQEGDLRGHALFADGAGAAVVTGLAGPMGNGIGKRGECAVILDRGVCRLVPSTRDHMTWTVGDHGFLMRLGSEVPETLAALLPDFVRELRAEAAESAELWAIHPGGPAILDRIESSHGLSSEDLHPARSVLRRHGNMSSATIFFVFEEILLQARKVAGNALAFGPGLTIEGLRFHVA